MGHGFNKFDHGFAADSLPPACRVVITFMSAGGNGITPALPHADGRRSGNWALRVLSRHDLGRSNNFSTKVWAMEGRVRPANITADFRRVGSLPVETGAASASPWMK